MKLGKMSLAQIVHMSKTKTIFHTCIPISALDVVTKHLTEQGMEVHAQPPQKENLLTFKLKVTATRSPPPPLFY